MGCSTGCAGYELVNDADFGTDLSGSGWLPTETFESTFEGNGHTISNLFIARRGASNVGLFGQTDADSVIKNVHLVSVSVTGGSKVGPLVGWNRGEVSGSSASGRVNGGSSIGGLVGQSYGTISESHATSIVSGDNNIGGLVGSDHSSTITNSHATGSVTALVATLGASSDAQTVILQSPAATRPASSPAPELRWAGRIRTSQHRYHSQLCHGQRHRR